jgi:hypothetical protein
MMRVWALTWPFCFGVRLGWATASVPNPSPFEARARVFFLRSQAVVFSGGFGAMCDRLRREGIWAEDLRCVGDRWVRRHLLAEQAVGRLRQPVILVGHSCGGRYALFTAQELARAGIAVELVVCIDVAGPYDVAANVRHAMHIYRSRWRIYPARPLQLAAGARGRISNLDVDASNSAIAPAWLHHLNITTSTAVQDHVIQTILDATALAEKQRRVA